VGVSASHIGPDGNPGFFYDLFLPVLLAVALLLERGFLSSFLKPEPARLTFGFGLMDFFFGILALLPYSNAQDYDAFIVGFSRTAICK
jgi:hypothetical protein